MAASTVQLIFTLLGQSAAAEDVKVKVPVLAPTVEELARLALGEEQEQRQQQPAAEAEPLVYEHPPWLSQCQYIYLDVGSNIGVQVRKLFEPEKFPGAFTLPLFEKRFGSPEARRAPGNVSGICALGFEPNPNWEKKLGALTSEFQEKGYFVHFYPYAVSGSDGTATFEVSDSDNLMDWGAHVMSLMQGRNITVSKIDFYRFLQELPPTSVVTLMKMDIEGSEWDVLARLMAAPRGLCKDRIGEAIIELHPTAVDEAEWVWTRSFEEVVSRLKQQKCEAGGPTLLWDLDDETYLDGENYDWRAALTA